MITRKELERKINSLKDELEYEKNLNREIKRTTSNGMLPLRGAECTSCKNCVIYVCKGRAFAIACAKDIKCRDYEKSDIVTERLNGYKYGSNHYELDADRILIDDSYTL